MGLRRQTWSTVAAMGVAAVVLLPLLGHRPLAEWDEGIYAEVSREMLGGSWLVPHWNFQVWLEKPPLMLWITAIFYKLFGVNEFWARAGSALSGVGIVGPLHAWLARRQDLLAAWLSTVALLATLGFLHVCHVGEMDVLLSLGACVALAGLASVDAGERQGWYFFWGGFAVAAMTKGAASIVIPVTAIVLALWQRWRSFGAAFWLGLLGFAALVLPWHLAMYLRFGQEFVAQYLGLQVLSRAAHQIEGHRTPWWFYLKVLLVSAPPFCLLYPVAIWHGLKRPGLRVWAMFSLVVVLLFSLAQTRLPHYVAPAYPALAVLTGAWIADWLRRNLAVFRESPWVEAWGFSPMKTDAPMKRALAPGLVVTAAAAVWALSLLATHSTLKSLHSAQRADGTTLLDNKESNALLRGAPSIAGPLLLWRAGQVQSIATDVFYSRRPVQQVRLEPWPSGAVIDRYMFAPQLLDDAVTAEPRLILLDRSLVARIPRRFRYEPLRRGTTVELGTIVRAPLPPTG